MKNVVVILCLLAASPVIGQVQERFKKTDQNTSEQQQDNRQKASSNKPLQTTPPKKEDFWDNVLIGGGVSLSFGTYTSIYLAPSVGYRVNDYWIVGTGYNYMYFRWNDNYYGNDTYESTIHGPKLFVNFFPFDGFYTGAQFEYLNHEVPSSQPVNGAYEFEKQWTPVLFLEAGISHNIGGKGVVQLGLRYNVLDDYDSPYNGAFFPVIGFMF